MKDYKFEMQKCAWRGIETVFTAAMYAWGWFFPDPKIIDGAGAIKKIPDVIAQKEKGDKKTLIVTDKGLMGLHLLDGLFEAMDAKGIPYVVYDEVQPNPSVENVETGLKLYNDSRCKCLVAVGGGSPMDCAKGIMARACRPDRPVKKMKGVFRIALPSLHMNGYLPPRLYAVPTTAGTGSETTIAAVITDTQTHDKFPLMDPLIRASYAVLDPEMTAGLPFGLTATTGLDALTHAIEGYTNIWYNDKKFNQLGADAVKLIFENLEEACNNPGNLDARAKLLEASYDAGMCFTRGGVGYVHGIGHRLGGMYGIPHGLAMSVILTHVFSDDFLGPYVYDKLAELGRYIGMDGFNDYEVAHKFMAAVRELEDKLNIPYGFEEIKDEDVDLIAERCLAEVMPTYPVKKIFTKEEIAAFIRKDIMIKK